jgi:hypothetical protein
VAEVGERSDVPLVTQGQIAATIAQLLGYDWRAVQPGAAPALPFVAPQRVSARSR